MRNRIIQVRHYSRKMMIMMLTGAICFSSCFCETAFAKTSKVRVYDVEKGTTGFTSFIVAIYSPLYLFLFTKINLKPDSHIMSSRKE